MSDAEITKSLGAVLSIVRDHAELLIGKGHVDADDLRLTIAARTKVVTSLRDKGMSEREIAKTINVSRGTVRRDLLGLKSPESGPKKPTPEKGTPELAKEA